MPVDSLTRQQVASALGLQDDTVSEYIRRRWLTAVRIGRRWSIDPASVERLLREGTPSVSGSRTATHQASQPATAIP
jgi:excisionase family DNA binding protein